MQETVKRDIDSGILNNTNRTHEFVDLLAKLEADKGVLFDFTNNAKIKETGFAIEGKQVNGYVQGNNIAINIDSTSALNKVVGHEIAHVLEGTELYTELANAVKELATTKGEYDSKLQSITKLYEGIEDVNIENELTADLIGEYLFTDSEFINRLSAEKPTLFQKIFDEIKYLCKVATAGSKEAKQLEKVKKTFEEAYRQKNNTAKDDGVKYSIEHTEDNQPVVIVEKNILEGVPKAEWTDKVKETMSQNFSSGIPIKGRLIKVNAISRDEFTNSKNTQEYRKHNRKKYRDKYKSANNLDEIILASTNYVNEDLKHERKDNFTEFARGNVLMRIGNNDYSAKVIIGLTSGQNMVLYDIVDFDVANFKIKKVDTDIVQSQTAKNNEKNVSTDNSLSQDESTVNNNSMHEERKNSLSNANEDIAPVRSDNVYGENIKLQTASAEDLAPIGENVVRKTTESENTIIDGDEPIQKIQSMEKTESTTHEDLVKQMSDIMDEATENDGEENLPDYFVDGQNKKETKSKRKTLHANIIAGFKSKFNKLKGRASNSSFSYITLMNF